MVVRDRMNRVADVPGRCLQNPTDQVRETGATVVNEPEIDPMAHLILAQRSAVALAGARGLDPDKPRHLSRSVVLS